MSQFWHCKQEFSESSIMPPRFSAKLIAFADRFGGSSTSGFLRETSIYDHRFYFGRSLSIAKCSILLIFRRFVADCWQVNECILLAGKRVRWQHFKKVFEMKILPKRGSVRFEKRVLWKKRKHQK